VRGLAVSKFIVIEGLIGVGKTSLCRLLEREWNARLILEPAEDNPFLASFYADPERFAFPAQMFYLATRYAQQIELCQGDLFSDLIVSDYFYAKDRLFAEQTLADVELNLYDRFTSLLEGSLATPEYILFLDAPTDVVLSRIASRGIHAEQVIEPSYLDSLRAGYYSLWSELKTCPVYVLNTTEIDYVNNPDDAAFMLAMLDGWLHGNAIPGAPAAFERRVVQLSLF